MRKAGPWAPKYSRPWLSYGNKWCFCTNKPLLGRMFAARNRRSRVDKGTDPLSSHERIFRTDKGYFSTIRTGDVRAGKDVMSVGHTSLQLNEIAKWLKVNELTLNVDKTQCMLFTRKRCKPKLNIKIENSSITQVTKTKFLGIIIDEKLNWKDNILHVSNKISKATGVIIKARILGKKALSPLFYSLIYPYLTYCCQVWGATYLYNIEILNRLQKRVIRIICSETKYAHNEPLFRELKILDVTNIYNYLVGKFMYRHHNNLLPDVFDSYFTKNRTTHDYETRQRNFFRIPEYKTNLGKRSVRYTGVKMCIEVTE